MNPRKRNDGSPRPIVARWGGEKMSKTRAQFFFRISIITCYHRSSVNIAFGVSRSELTKPGDQSMAGFDFINNTIKSGDRSMAGLDPIEVYISK